MIHATPVERPAGGLVGLARRAALRAGGAFLCPHVHGRYDIWSLYARWGQSGGTLLRRLFGWNSVDPRIGKLARCGYTTRVLAFVPALVGVYAAH